MELLIVVVILGILSAIALPTFLNQRDAAAEAAGAVLRAGASPKEAARAGSAAAAAYNVALKNGLPPKAAETTASAAINAVVGGAS